MSGPTAPPAAGHVLPARRDASPSVGATGCEPLAQLLDTVAELDRLQARAVRLTARLQVSNEDVEQTGLPADLWLTVTGRMTRSDRRMLAAVAEHLARLPLTANEFTHGGLSWSQIRTIVALLLRHRIRHDEWPAVDAAVATAVGRAADGDPDEVPRQVEDWLWRRHPERLEADEADQADRRFLALQPRLDRLGGRFWGETDAAGLALLDAATRPDPDHLPDGDRLTPVGRVGRARHDLLMSQLGGGRGSDDQRLPTPTVLATIDINALIGFSESHGELLASLAGGRLHVSAPTARRLLSGGFNTRLIVLDETGQVLGVGRRTRIAPEWLRDAIRARDAECTFPGCHRTGLVSHIDHAVPWAAGGPTDIANLAAVCGPHNRAKERDGWTARGHPDGSRTWHHPRTASPPTASRPLPDSQSPATTHATTTDGLIACGGVRRRGSTRLVATHLE